MTQKLLMIDLFAGLGGWAEGGIAEGYRVIGFDIERHQYGDAKYPAQLVIQDVLTLHGRQFRDATLIVASPPCQEFSYMAMPWTLAKQKQARIMADPIERKRLTALFDACFRIQREACEAAGRHIPLVVENVKGAQKWVGRARWNFGSFYLWGDVPALMPITMRAGRKQTKFVPNRGWTASTAIALGLESYHGQKNNGGSWFNIGSPGQKETNRNPIHEAVKVASEAGRRTDIGKGARFTSRDCGDEGIKQHGSGPAWFDNGICKSGSKSNARKAASAAIAKIPLVLARHIARTWKPLRTAA